MIWWIDWQDTIIIPYKFVSYNTTSHKLFQGRSLESIRMGIIWPGMTGQYNVDSTSNLCHFSFSWRKSKTTTAKILLINTKIYRIIKDQAEYFIECSLVPPSPVVSDLTRETCRVDLVLIKYLWHYSMCYNAIESCLTVWDLRLW